jgi:ribonuclease HI
VSTQAPRRAFGVSDLSEFAARLAELRIELTPPTSPGRYVAHTDGACLGNPEGPGGWAAVVEAMPECGPPWLLWGHLSSTSNNRAEALGVLAAIEWVPPGARLEIHSDSELTVRILQGRYKAKANPDIWDAIRRAIADKGEQVSADWLRGHAGDPRNELADRLSKLGAEGGSANELQMPGLDLARPGPPGSDEPAELAGLEPRGDWERDFLRSVARQLKGGRALSPRQQAVIARIRARGAGSA